MNRQNDKKKDGKKSSLSSFGGGRSGYDSFGSYMQRKMELQKKQFGLRLPPKIPPSSTLVAEATTTTSAAPPQPPAPPSSLSDSSRSSSGLLAIVDRLKRRHNSCNDTTTVSEHNANNNAFISPKEHGNAPSNEQSRKLFLHPLVFHINGLISRKGFDDVSLQRLIQSRGGDVSKYITPSIHFIVAESLSTAKVRIYQRSKRPVPVVYPDWIAECDLRGKRVDWRPFLIEEVRGVRFSGVMEEGCLWKFMNSNSNDGGDEHILKKRYRGGKQDEVKSQNKIMRVGRYSGAKVGSSSKKQDEEVKEKREEKDKGEHDLNPHNSMLDHMDCKSVAEVATVETTKKFNKNIVLSTEKKPESTHQFSSASSHSKHAKRNLQGKNNNITSAANEKSEQQQQHRPEIDAPKKKLNQQFPVMAKTIAKHQISKTHLTEPPSFPSSHRNPYVTQGRNVGNDPNFLKEYFASSRLSFIDRHRERHNMQQYQPQHNFAAAKKSFSSPSHSIKNIVLHVDMDCFFASVILRKYPQHRDQAVAVGHCDRPTPLSCLPRGSTGELSTCNYLARRQYGIRKGMWISSARVACPSLVMLPYDQEGYAEVSHTVVNILNDIVSCRGGIVETVSCDESYLSVPSPASEDDEEESFFQMLATDIRERIVTETNGCTASIGVGPNKLIAKLATDAVKPNGYNILLKKLAWKNRLAGISLKELPGVGRVASQKLQDRGLTNVHDVWDLGITGGKEILVESLGRVNGLKIFNYCYGMDDRKVEAATRKTIGAECNYGVRFEGPYGVDYMLDGLSAEVEKRMTDANLRGSRITLKVMQRKHNAPCQAVKYNGHGPCNALSKSGAIIDGNKMTRNAASISSAALALFHQLHVEKEDVRGMGIVVSHLDNVTTKDQQQQGNCDRGVEANSMAVWLLNGASSSPKVSSSSLSLQSSTTLEKKCKSLSQKAATSSCPSSVCDAPSPPNRTKTQATAIVDQQPLPSSPSNQNMDLPTSSVSSFQNAKTPKTKVGRGQDGHKKHVHPNYDVPAHKSPLQRHEKNIDDDAKSTTSFTLLSPYCPHNLLAPRLSQVDMHIMKSLPNDIQRELEEELGKEKQNEGDSYCSQTSVLSSSLQASQPLLREKYPIVLDLTDDSDNENDEEKELVLDLTDDSDTDDDGYCKGGENAIISSIDCSAINCRMAQSSDREGGFVTSSTSVEEQGSQVLITTDRATPKAMSVSSILAPKHRKRIGTSTTSISNSVPAKTTNYLDRNQPSMTQMVKLASVHSGHDEMRERFGGNAVSLTQLRLLPLRLQLKIANNHDLDEKNVSFLRKGTRGTVGPYSSQGGTGQDNRSIVSGNEQIQNKIEKRRSYTIPPPAPFAAVEVCNYEKMIENDSSDGNDVLSLLSGDPPDSISTYATDLHSADPTFLQNDLLPFVGYLDSTITSSSCHPTHDDISNVCQFLRICIKENRTCAVVALLHNMKQRNDAWGRRSSHAGNAIQENGSSDHFNLYTFVVGEVQEQYFLSEWRCLDIVGLGL